MTQDMEKQDEKGPEGDEVKPFMAHLEDLRIMLIRSAIALIAGMLVCIPFVPVILSVLKRPLAVVTTDPDRFLRSLEVGGAFSVTVQVAFWSGLLVSAPFLFLFIGAFVFPGLTSKERRLVTRAGGFAVLLFVLGVCMGYFLTLPAALRIMFGMHGWLGITAEWTVTSYVMFATQLLIGFGIAFELPAALLVLVKMRLVSYAQLRTARPYAVIVVLLLGMVLTPPDVVSQLLMAVPLWLLYEMCVWIAWAGERGEGKRK